MAIDLDAYFRRIGYEGSRVPSLETLRAINLLHPQAIAFENLNPLMGWPVPLDAASLESKLVKGGRGGYCFEQNLLLDEVLKALGFRVKGLSGRVIRGAPANTVRPRTHMLLLVDLDDGLYVVDVGFGIAALTAPLRLRTDIEQPTPHETYRLTGAGDDFEMQVGIGPDWIGLYRFDLQEQSLPDYEMRNWYTSTHPASQFVTNLMVARADARCRHTLLDTAYTRRFPGAPSERRKLESVAEMREILRDVFRIALPDSPDLDTALGRVLHP